MTGVIAHATLNWVGPGIVDAFVQAGHRVYAPDARGHGASEKVHDPARYGELNMAQDVSAIIDLIGEPAVDLVGYSMGGVVALHTTIKDARVRRLVVLPGDHLSVLRDPGFIPAVVGHITATN